MRSITGDVFLPCSALTRVHMVELSATCGMRVMILHAPPRARLARTAKAAQDLRNEPMIGAAPWLVPRRRTVTGREPLQHLHYVAPQMQGRNRQLGVGCKGRAKTGGWPSRTRGLDLHSDPLNARLFVRWLDRLDPITQIRAMIWTSCCARPCVLVGLRRGFRCGR
jgi:hypothetical protein